MSSTQLKMFFLGLKRDFGDTSQKILGKTMGTRKPKECLLSSITHTVPSPKKKFKEKMS
jgi:hypothetical protein